MNGLLGSLLGLLKNPLDQKNRNLTAILGCAAVIVGRPELPQHVQDIMAGLTGVYVATRNLRDAFHKQ